MNRRPALSLKGRALQWLALREHSPKELRQKLLRAAREAEASTQVDGLAREDRDSAQVHAVVDELMQWLDAQGFLSAERFIESRVHVRQGRFGQQRIQQELARHGLELGQPQRDALKASEAARAAAVWARKYGTVAADPREQLRQMRFMSARGFAPELVRRVVRGDGAPEDLPLPADDA